jgi:membrane protein involved in colicin uptake
MFIPCWSIGRDLMTNRNKKGIVGFAISVGLHAAIVAVIVVSGSVAPHFTTYVDSGEGMVLSLGGPSSSASSPTAAVRDQSELSSLADQVADRSASQAPASGAKAATRPDVLKELDAEAEAGGSRSSASEHAQGGKSAAVKAASGADLDPWAQAAISSEAGGRGQVLAKVLNCWQGAPIKGVRLEMSLADDGRLSDAPRISRGVATRNPGDADLIGKLQNCAPYPMPGGHGGSYAFSF